MKALSLLHEGRRLLLCLQRKGDCHEISYHKKNRLLRYLPGARAGAALPDRSNPADRQHALAHAHPGAAVRLPLRLALGPCGGRPRAAAAFADLELAAYGALSGLLYAKLPKKALYVYVTLILSMLGGRIVWGLVMFALMGFSTTAFPFSAFIAGAFTKSIPGLILHIVLIPVIVLALRKAKLSLNEG